MSSRYARYTCASCFNSRGFWTPWWNVWRSGESASRLRDSSRSRPSLVYRDDRGVSIKPNGIDQAGFAEVPELAVTRVERPIECVAEVAGGHHAEGADGAQRGAAETSTSSARQAA